MTALAIIQNHYKCDVNTFRGFNIIGLFIIIITKYCSIILIYLYEKALILVFILGLFFLLISFYLKFF